MACCMCSPLLLHHQGSRNGLASGVAPVTRSLLSSCSVHVCPCTEQALENGAWGRAALLCSHSCPCWRAWAWWMGNQHLPACRPQLTGLSELVLDEASPGMQAGAANAAVDAALQQLTQASWKFGHTGGGDVAVCGQLGQPLLGRMNQWLLLLLLSAGRATAPCAGASLMPMLLKLLSRWPLPARSSRHCVLLAIWSAAIRPKRWQG